MERGYKAWCERYSVDKRLVLGGTRDGPLDPWVLAKHLGVRVWTPADVPGLSVEDIAILLRTDVKRSCWSAVTIVVGTKAVVVLNSTHGVGRQASDLTHELAHRIRGHEAKEVAVSESGLMLLESYNRYLEEEADILSSTLLLPRESLVYIQRRGISDEEAAAEYGVSVQMLKYRKQAAGIYRQFA